MTGGPGVPGASGPFGAGAPGPPDGSGRSPRRPQLLTLIAAAAAIVVVIAVVGIILGTRGGSESESVPAAPAPVGEPGPPDPTGAAPVPGTPPTQAAQLSPEDALRGLLNTVTMTGCSAPARSDSTYADATLNCIGAGGIEVLAYHFPDRAALERQIGARATYYTDSGQCDAGQESAEEWTSLQEPNGGARLCYKYADRFVTFWSINDSLVAFAASDPDPARLMTWWHGFDPIRR